ncbi:FG-GAP repeat protein [Solirubrobacter ginsenosidimutans]|nr:FG-GAP repeat protein [Solirubrobacter ginsenosidimutans]
MLLSVLALTGTAQAAVTRLQAPNSALFGLSVALSADGSTALVGAPSTDSAQGAAFVFARSGGNWVLQQKLKAAVPSPVGITRFGFSVSLSADGRTALIGAQGSNPAVGGADTAYVFARTAFSGFSQQQQLLNPAGAFSGNQFGNSVSLSSDGRTALVGAPSPPSGSGGVGGGAVYTFARGLVGWTLQQKLGVNSASFDAFGYSVSVSSDGRSALIGAPSKDGTGAAYLFARGLAGGFVRQQQLLAAGLAAGDGFGQSVSLSGDARTAVIGAPDKAVGPAGGAGAAYVFARGVVGGFTQQQQLQPASRAANDQFGNAVSLDRGGTRALVGASGTDAEKGAAYVFGRGFAGGFTQRQRLQADDRADGDFFGWAAALSADSSVSLLGAPQIGGDGPRNGAAYAFTGLG